MSELSSDSITNTISKLDAEERITVEPVPPQVEEMISNERIRKGDKILGTYTVLCDAVHGGMGSVWKVHHKDWNTDLAMKRPQPKYFAEGSAERKQNFIRECESWISLGLHPNIVSCYYVREIGGVPTIFSEWMDNGSLGDHIKDGSLYEGSEEEAGERLLDIAVQFAEGLYYAHESEVHLVHQDVKPDNLLLTKEWDAKVSDFGLSRARALLPNDSHEESSTEHFVQRSGYTPAYCSAEQLDGRALSVRTDIYSWAVSVLEMYLGDRPWKNGAEAGRHCSEYFDRCRVHMPASLRSLLKYCLAEKEEERPHDFGIILDELKRIYRDTAGVDYLRPRPEAVRSAADALNNSALSYLDLGKTEKAVQLLKDAMVSDSHASDPVYNYALLSWRRGDLSDEECIEFIKDHSSEEAECIYRERGTYAWSSEPDSILQETVGIHDYDRGPLWEKELAALKRSAVPGRFVLQTMTDDFFLFEYNEDRWTVRAADQYRDPDVFIRKGRTEFAWFDFASNQLYLQKWNEDVICGEKHFPQTLRFVNSEGNIRAVSASDGYITLYDSAMKKIRVIPAEIEDIEYSSCFCTETDDLIICSAGKISVIETVNGTISTVFETEGSVCINDAILRNGDLYILTETEIILLGREYAVIKRIRLHGSGYRTIGVMPDGDHIVTAGTYDPEYYDDRQCVLRVYSVREQRCILTERFSAFGDFTEEETFLNDSGPLVLVTGEDSFSLVFSGTSASRERRSSLMNYRGGNLFGSYFLFIENFRLPEAGEKSEFCLSKVRNIKENIETAKKFEAQLQKARSAYEEGDIHSCMEDLEACYAMQGFKENDRLRRLNRKAGQDRKVLSLRYIRPFEENSSPLWKEEDRHLIGTDRILTKAEVNGSSEYHLWNWETAELIRSFPAGADTVFGCTASDESAVFAIEDIKEDSFCLHRMDLEDGTSSKRYIHASIAGNSFCMASDGRRVLMDSEHKIRIAAEDGREPLITFNSDKQYAGLHSPVFTRDGRYVCTSIGLPDRDCGEGLHIYPAESFFGSETESICSSAGAFEQIAVNAENTAVSALSAHHLPFLFCPDTDRKEMFRAQCGYDSDHVFFTPDGSGIIALGEDGSAGMFIPRDRKDYVLYAREKGNEMPPEGFRYDPVVEQYVKYTDAGPVLTKDAPLENAFARLKMTQKYTPASDIASGPGMRANSTGTAFLDAAGRLWVIDYVYSEEEKDGFQTWKKIMKKQDTAKKADRKGFLSRLFKGRS